MAVYICLTLLAAFISVFYLFYKKKYSYWSDKGVNGPTPLPVFGNYARVFLQKQFVSECIRDIYLKYPNERLVGLYRGFQPMLLVRDPELLKQIFVRDFDSFQDRPASSSGSKLSTNLFTARGEQWRLMRQKLTPVFTSRKLKEMTPLISQCVERYVEYINYLLENNVDHEIRALTGKYTLEVIASCAFGLEINTFKDEKNKFLLMAKKIFTRTLWAHIVTLLDMFIPGLRKRIIKNREVQDFFVDLVRKVVKERENKPSNRKDFMNMLIELRNQGKITKNMHGEQAEIVFDETMMAAQALVFYSAGYDTSAAALSFLLYDLALNQDIQERLYNNILQAIEKHNGEINYESIKEMTYLETVLNESLRKHSVAGLILRTAVTNYTFPGTNVTIPKGTIVLASAMGMNHDPKFFPDPDRYNPENLRSDNLQKLPQCSFIPFGEGPRSCIGLRFAKLQSLIGMAMFLKEFKVEPSLKTKPELKYDPKPVILTASGGIWLKISRRK